MYGIMENLRIDCEAAEAEKAGTLTLTGPPLIAASFRRLFFGGLLPDGQKSDTRHLGGSLANIAPSFYEIEPSRRAQPLGCKCAGRRTFYAFRETLGYIDRPQGCRGICCE
jgi:hypothetical protein